jgi:hypothetical protein
MYFTKGRLLEYERMMKQTPRPEHDPVPPNDRDCRPCLHVDERSGKGSRQKSDLLDK